MLDEADRMLDMGFIHDVRRILELAARPRSRPCFFSATMPTEVHGPGGLPAEGPGQGGGGPRLLSRWRSSTRASTLWTASNKTKLLFRARLGALEVKNALVFTRTKHGANKVAGDLVKAGISAAGHPRQQEPDRPAAGPGGLQGRAQVQVPGGHGHRRPGHWTSRSCPTCSTTTCPT